MPGGLMVTMDAAEGADLMDMIGARITVPVHFDDYGLFTSPLVDFRTETHNRGTIAGVRFVARGDTINLQATPTRPREE